MPPRSATSNAERDRLLGDVARMGSVASVDHEKYRVTVAIGDLLTGPLPWQAMRAGKMKVWAPPSIGEQVLVICPEGDIAAGVVLPGFFCDANPMPTDQDVVWIEFADGSKITFDHESHELAVVLPVDGRLRVVGDIEVVGDITVKGGITTTQDVVADRVSLKSHRHPGVQTGPGLTLPPQVSA